MRSRIAIPFRGLLILVLTFFLTSGIALDRGAWGALAPPNEWERCLTFDPDTGEPRIDGACFFDALVDRYRNLTAYEDVAEVLQVTERDGEQPERVETRIGSKVEDGRLRVETPASEARRRLGLDTQPRMSPAMQMLRLRYNLWMAPHMALKFAAQPQRDFRSGVREGFVSVEAQAVKIDDKTMVHLALTSPEGPEGDGAKFDLFVNPESMLVERIQGEQRLPDGARYETRLDITPTLAVAAEADMPVDHEVPEVPVDSGAAADAPGLPGMPVPHETHETHGTKGTHEPVAPPSGGSTPPPHEPPLA